MISLLFLSKIVPLLFITWFTYNSVHTYDIIKLYWYTRIELNHDNTHKVAYSKTCVKRPLKIDKTKISMTNDSLMKVKVLQNPPLGAFCNTFDLH